MNITELTKKVEDLASDCEMDCIGFAPVSRFNDAPKGRRPKDILPTAKSVIVFAVHILDSLVDGLPESRYEYTSQFFILNGVLNNTTLKVSRFLEDQGFRAFPIPAAYPRVNKRIFGVFSHRHAAVQAGIGEFAVNNLLTTSRFGPRVRLSSIITEAEFEYSQVYTGELCKDYVEKCNYACVKNCPVGALTQEGKIDKYKCLHYQEQIMPWSAVELRCGLCMGSCPIGKKKWPITAGKIEADVKEMKDLWTGAKW